MLEGKRNAAKFLNKPAGRAYIIWLHTKAEVQSPPSSYLSLFYAHVQADAPVESVASQKIERSGVRIRGVRESPSRPKLLCGRPRKPTSFCTRIGGWRDLPTPRAPGQDRVCRIFAKNFACQGRRGRV